MIRQPRVVLGLLKKPFPDLTCLFSVCQLILFMFSSVRDVDPVSQAQVKTDLKRLLYNRTFFCVFFL
ncbi:hypothetical protein TNCV_4996311 [Trichonephila clavipes]|nr:hypothetical protein TNCV_4996311 [Trichonephila clavipes]